MLKLRIYDENFELENTIFIPVSYQLAEEINIFTDSSKIVQITSRPYGVKDIMINEVLDEYIGDDIVDIGSLIITNEGFKMEITNPEYEERVDIEADDYFLYQWSENYTRMQEKREKATVVSSGGPDSFFNNAPSPLMQMLSGYYISNNYEEMKGLKPCRNMKSFTSKKMNR